MAVHRSIPTPTDPRAAEPGLAPQPPAMSRRAFVASAAAAATGGALFVAFGLGRSEAGTSGEASTGAAGTATASAGGSTAAAKGVAGTTVSTTAVGGIETDKLVITVADGYRSIWTASMPDDELDASFRYPGTPSAQDLTYRVTTSPQIAEQATFVQTGQVVGVRLDSVVFDPKTAEYFGGTFGGAWNGTARGLDAYGAHARPDGFYHAHQVTDRWVSDPSTHSALVAWAADGFPMYLRYGYGDGTDASSAVTNLRSSYRLRSGARPSGADSPGGTYDGTYVADYEYVEGLGDLDECNGRWCVTPEFPDGTYAYFLTDGWPYLPNYLRGTPDPSFAPGNGGGSGGPPGGGR